MVVSNAKNTSTIHKAAYHRGRLAVADEIRHVSMNDMETHLTPKTRQRRKREGGRAMVLGGTRPLTLQMGGGVNRTCVTPPPPYQRTTELHARAHVHALGYRTVDLARWTNLWTLSDRDHGHWASNGKKASAAAARLASHCAPFR